MVNDGVGLGRQILEEQFAYASRFDSAGGVCGPSTFDVWAQDRVIGVNVLEGLATIQKALLTIDARLARLEKHMAKSDADHGGT